MYNPSDKYDLDKLLKWRSKQAYLVNGKKNSYFNAEVVWTIRDVLKVKIAIENKLNYMVLYKDCIYKYYNGELINE